MTDFGPKKNRLILKIIVKSDTPDIVALFSRPSIVSVLLARPGIVIKVNQ